VEVACLFASGSREDPSPPPPPTEEADDDPRALATRLLELGGTDPELASDPEFIELVLPYVTADGRMFHAYELELEPRLRCPVMTIVGDVDTDADRRPWTDLTTGGFTEQIVRGDHFYLIADPPFALLRDRLAPTTNGDGDDGTP
jgi:pyochelin biosynthetic protein PchC